MKSVSHDVQFAEALTLREEQLLAAFNDAVCWHRGNRRAPLIYPLSRAQPDATSGFTTWTGSSLLRRYTRAAFSTLRSPISKRTIA